MIKTPTDIGELIFSKLVSKDRLLPVLSVLTNKCQDIEKPKRKLFLKKTIAISKCVSQARAPIRTV